MSISDDIDRFVREGYEAQENEDYVAAIAFFESAVKLGDDTLGFELGECFVALGEYGKAADAFKTCWDRGIAEAGYNYGRSLVESGQVQLGRQVYQELASRGNAAAMHEEAYFLRYDGLLSESRVLMLKATESSDDTGDVAAASLGVWLWTEDRDPAAEALLRRGAYLGKRTRRVLATMLLHLGRDEEALEVLDEGVKNDEVESLLLYANLMWKRGELARAEMFLRKCVELNDSVALFPLYQVLHEQGNDCEAEIYLRWAFDTCYQNAEEVFSRRHDQRLAAG